VIRALDAATPDAAVIREAAQALAAGKLIILPTETVYGIACDPRVTGAEEAVYRAKGRPSGKPIARFIRTRDELFPSGEVRNPVAMALAREFMPGPLTLVLPFRQDWVGFRIPDHPVPLALLDALGAPLAVTSANRSEAPDPACAEDAARQLGDSVHLILDAGPCDLGRASTVVRVNGTNIELLREGAVAKELIFETARSAGVVNDE
jgi:L-threonylcarbamoyladenylate synthase